MQFAINVYIMGVHNERKICDVQLQSIALQINKCLRVHNSNNQMFVSVLLILIFYAKAV